MATGVIVTVGVVGLNVALDEESADPSMSWEGTKPPSPEVLGDWQPACDRVTFDSDGLYRNLAWQPEFADRSRELWQFADWQPAARTAAKPLAECGGSYLAQLADYVAVVWGDPRAAEIVREELLVLAGASASTSTDDLLEQISCEGDCEVTGTVRFDHPTWGESTLATTAEGFTGRGGGSIVVVDGAGELRWQYSNESWYTLAPAAPSQDQSGNVFLVYNPGRYDGLVVLRPVGGGFDDFGSLPGQGEPYARFYSAALDDVEDDGLYEIVVTINLCDPSCAGSERFVEEVYRWTGEQYVAE